MEILWTKEAQKKYDVVIDSLPQFHRTIAKQLVKVKAEELAQERKSGVVEEEDLIIAFFQEVPPAFRDMMKKLLTKHNINYEKHIKE